MTFGKYIINGEVIFDVNANELQPLLEENGEKVVLNAPTARCLMLLIESHGQIVSREEFLEIVWKAKGIVVSQNTFYQNISLLRKSLVKAGLSQDIIITVRQRGFTLALNSFITPISQSENSDPNNILDVPSMEITLRQSVTKIASQESGEKKRHEKSLVAFKLPFWALTLFIIMVAANAFFVVFVLLS